MKRCLLAVVFLLIPALGMADSHEGYTVEMWQCELKEGKTMEALEANNKKWLAMTRAAAGNEEINSYLMTPIVGDLKHFVFVDAYPTLAAWSAAKSAESTDEGEAIEATFNDLQECHKNRLYKSKKH